MHAQELLFASTSRQFLAPSCGSLAVGSCKTQELLCGWKLKAQELLCGRNLEWQELLCGKIFKPQELLYSIVLARRDLYQDGARQGPVYIFTAPALAFS